MALKARLILSEWLPGHPGDMMTRSWELDEVTRRRIVRYLEQELGPPREELLPMEGMRAMGEAAEANGLTVWVPER